MREIRLVLVSIQLQRAGMVFMPVGTVEMMARILILLPKQEFCTKMVQ